MAMVEDRLSALAPRETIDIGGLRSALSVGGVTLLTGGSADGVADMLEAEPGPLRLGRLSEHAGGQGHLSAWACLAFGLTPFDLEPQPARLAAFTAAAGPAALAVERAERLTDAELVALAGIGKQSGFALLLLGGEDLARRAQEPALAALVTSSPAPITASRQAQPRAARESAARAPEEPRDAFGLIAAAVARAEKGQAEAEPAAPAAAPLPVAAPARRTWRAHAAFAAFAALAVTATAAMMAGVAPEPAPSPAAAPTLAAAPEAERAAVAGTADSSASVATPASLPAPIAATAFSLEAKAAPAPGRAAAAALATKPADEALASVAPPQTAPRLLPPEAPEPARAAPVAFQAPAGDSLREEAARFAFRSPAPRPRPIAAAFVAPPSEAPWVVIHHAPESRPLAEALSVALRGGEFAHVALREVGFDVSADHVRYYFAEDGARAGALAEALAGALGSGIALRDFTGADRLPGRMTLEVWLAGGAG